LNDFTNDLGFRFSGNLLRTVKFARQTVGSNIDANPEDRTELGFPSQELRQEGLLSDEEYQHKRLKIIEGLWFGDKCEGKRNNGGKKILNREA
jgi:hypothetical protein